MVKHREGTEGKDQEVCNGGTAVANDLRHRHC